uniref:Uncharacterized protein n=1 Tax=Heterorhabditis bacteriophora TaxID=37862 RepID=A0A1I7WI46_HETBA
MTKKNNNQCTQFAFFSLNNAKIWEVTEKRQKNKMCYHFETHCSILFISSFYSLSANFTSFVNARSKEVGLKNDQGDICFSMTIGINIINLNLNSTNNKIPTRLIYGKNTNYNIFPTPFFSIYNYTANFHYYNQEKI